MLKISAALCLAICSAAASAGDYKFINTDGSVLGQLCIAAAESQDRNSDSIASLAAEFGISPVEVNSVRCNGSSLAAFASKFAADKSVTIRTYVVSLGDSKPESQLCLAALVSDEEAAKLAATHFQGVPVKKEILCNGLPINLFVEKYRDHLAAPLRTNKEVASR